MSPSSPIFNISSMPRRSIQLLIVVQGIDAAGKDGTCWHVITAMNPQGTTVTGFKQPTRR